MPAIASKDSRSNLDSVISQLKQGSKRLRESSLEDQRKLVEACIANVSQSAKDWVSAVCNAKRISAEQAISSEEVLVGPGSLLRYLRLLSKTLSDFERHGKPQLPGKPRVNSCGQTCVPILPVQSLFDSLIFLGLKGEVWLNQDADCQDFFADHANLGDLPRVAGVPGCRECPVRFRPRTCCSKFSMNMNPFF